MYDRVQKFVDDLTFTNLRYLFYLVTPNETTYYTVEDVPHFTERVSNWFLVLIILEAITLKIAGYKHRNSLNDSLTSVTAGMLSQLPKFGGRAISLIAYSYVYEHFRLFDVPYDSVWVWVLGFLAQDLAYYLAHRAIHEAGVFWAFHQMHHSSEYYNLTTALRQGVFQEIGTTFFECLESIVIPPPMFLTHKALNTVYQFWIHNEIVPKLGPLEYILNTPSHHRVHHGRNPYCIDKNYAGVLIIWDRIFGTFEAERDDEKPVYGLVTNVKSFNPIWLQLFEFKDLGWDKPRMKDTEHKDLFPGLWTKLQTVLMPPGYFPGVKTKRFFWWKCMEDPTEGIPKIEEKVLRYNPPLNLWETLYVVAQFIIAIISYKEFLATRNSLSYATCIAYLALLISTIQAIGYFLDKSIYAARFDIVRLIFIIAYSVYTENMILTSISLSSLAYNYYLLLNVK